MPALPCLRRNGRQIGLHLGRARDPVCLDYRWRWFRWPRLRGLAQTIRLRVQRRGEEEKAKKEAMHARSVAGTRDNANTRARVQMISSWPRARRQRGAQVSSR